MNETGIRPEHYSVVHRAIATATAVVMLTGCGIAREAKSSFNRIAHPSTTTPNDIQPKTGDTTPATVGSNTALECVAQLPLEQRAGQLVMVSVYGRDLVADAPILASEGIGGAVVMTSPANPNDGSLLKLKNTSKIPILLATDEEGGVVQRFRDLGVLPAPATVAQTMSPAQAEGMVAAHARQLKQVGIDVVFGPVADVSPVAGTGPLGNRTFGNDPAIVKTYLEAYVRGWSSAGILPTAKHLPGLGSASGNTDFVAAQTPPLNSLLGRDLLPYVGLPNTGMGLMMGNMVVPGLTSNGELASFSSAAISLMRNHLGYHNNLVFTDALGAAAVAQSGNDVPTAAEKFIEAGGDMMLAMYVEESANRRTLSTLGASVITRLTNAVRQGRLAEADLNTKVIRILEAKGVDPCKVTR